MKNLKLRSNLFGLFTMALFALLITSCADESLRDQSPETAPESNSELINLIAGHSSFIQTTALINKGLINGENGDAVSKPTTMNNQVLGELTQKILEDIPQLQSLENEEATDIYALAYRYNSSELQSAEASARCGYNCAEGPGCSCNAACECAYDLMIGNAYHWYLQVFNSCSTNACRNAATQNFNNLVLQFQSSLYICRDQC